MVIPPPCGGTNADFLSAVSATLGETGATAGRSRAHIVGVTRRPSPSATTTVADLSVDGDTDANSRAVAIVDINGRVRAVSGAFTSTLRIRRDELLSLPLPQLVVPDERPALAHAISAVGTGEWPGCALELHFLQHERDERAVRLVLEGEGAQRVRLTAHDLTAEREATRTLQELESGLRALTQHSLDIWALVSDTGLFRSVSESISAHLGWTPQELEGGPLLDLLAPEEAEPLAALLAELKADPQAVRSIVVRARHRLGGWRTLETTVSGFNPNLLGSSVFVLNARDVTARERTEAALREVEYRFSRLVEQALTGIVVVQEGRVVYANPRFLQLAGLGADALATRPRALSLVARESLPGIRAVQAELATGATQAARVQLTGRRQDGRTVDVDVATSVVDFEGRPALLCTVTDMTDARALQRRMAEAEKVEAVGLLAGGVAHDFNNMLTGILAWVDIAGDEVAPGSAVAMALGEIRTAADRAAELTRQLLAFGRRQLLDPRPLDLGEVAVRLKRWMDRALGADHRLELVVPDSTWLIEADRTQIERALTALIMNAQDAMPGGGEIAMTVAHRTLSAEEAERLGPLRAGDHVLVSVRDRGVGMDEATRRRIFEPFFTTKPQGRGTGLGLAAVMGTVLQSGGAIDVQTAPGEGTTFRCWFPRLSEAAAAAPGPRRERHAPPRVARRVLVVEDEAELGKVLRKLLHDGGHQARHAADAAEAEALVASEPVDVLVCDVQLPGTNGAALAGALRARGVARATVLISGRPITEEECAAAGPGAVTLHKPFRPQRLLDAVDEAVRLASAR